MLLTLADTGTKEIKIFGGENLTHFLTATRGFVMRYYKKKISILFFSI